MKRKILLLTLTISALSCLTGCNIFESKSLGSSSDIATNDAVATLVPTEDTKEVSIEETNKPDKIESTDNVTKETIVPTKNVNNTSNKKANNSNTTVFRDYLETQEYVVKANGNYSFVCKPSDGKATWTIYVLDEKFEDALRYLTSAYDPTLTVTSKVQNLKLTKGQYVYCVCSQNSLTFDGDEDSFTCPLAITLN